jgi:hypothetical protein
VFVGENWRKLECIAVAGVCISNVLPILGISAELDYCFLIALEDLPSSLVRVLSFGDSVD